MDEIQKTWEVYFGEPITDDCGDTFIPPAPLTYVRGYKDGVESARKELLINIDSHHHSCADGCCDEYWDEITINGENDRERFSSLDAESIEKVLNYLKIPHKFIHNPIEE